ncbi:MAG: zinc ABC transporter permease, partial [Bacteroidaceae bacterium]
LGLPQTGLLVDQGNPKAEKLYRSLGFEEANQTTWGGHAMKHLTLKAPSL